MKTFEVEVQEVSINTYTVEANNEDEAKAKVMRGDYQSQDLFPRQMAEFSHTLESDEYPKCVEV